MKSGKILKNCRDRLHGNDSRHEFTGGNRHCLRRIPDQTISTHVGADGLPVAIPGSDDHNDHYRDLWDLGHNWSDSWKRESIQKCFDHSGCWFCPGPDPIYCLTNSSGSSHTSQCKILYEFCYPDHLPAVQTSRHPRKSRFYFIFKFKRNQWRISSIRCRYNHLERICLGFSLTHLYG